MRFEKTVEEKYTIVKLLEEKLDSRISPSLKSEFINLSAAGTKHVILDLEAVKYADSSGLSSILTGNRIFNNEGTFTLCCLSPHVNKLITISHLETVLNILPTSSEAVESVFMNELEDEIRQQEGS